MSGENPTQNVTISDALSTGKNDRVNSGVTSLWSSAAAYEAQLQKKKREDDAAAAKAKWIQDKKVPENPDKNEKEKHQRNQFQQWRKNKKGGKDDLASSTNTSNKSHSTPPLVPNNDSK